MKKQSIDDESGDETRTQKIAADDDALRSIEHVDHRAVLIAGSDFHRCVLPREIDALSTAVCESERDRLLRCGRAADQQRDGEIQTLHLFGHGDHLIE